MPSPINNLSYDFGDYLFQYRPMCVCLYILAHICTQVHTCVIKLDLLFVTF